jgi:hypothetical protein
MRTEEDFEPMFNGMTELEFQSLAKVAVRFANRNNIQFEGTDGAVDDLRDELQDSEDEVEKLKNELELVRDKIKDGIKNLANI